MAAFRPATARTLFILAVLVLWETLARVADINPILLAPPSTVLVQVARILANVSTVPDFYSHAWVTVKELAVAYAICAVVGVLAGLAFANSKVVGDAFEPILLVLYALPKVILYPLLVLILGIGLIPKIV